MIGTVPRENGPSEHLCDTEQINAKEQDATSDKNKALEGQEANEHCAPESETAGETAGLALPEWERPDPLAGGREGKAQLGDIL